MSWLDDLLGKTVQGGGTPVVDRKILNFVSGATVADNPATRSTDVTITAGGGGFGGSISAKTSNYSVLSGDAGKTFTNTGAGGTVVLTLPAASVALSFAFSVEVAHILEVLAIGSDVIRIGGAQSGSAGNIQSDSIGSTLIIQCTKAGVWSTLGGASGTWAVT